MARFGRISLFAFLVMIPSLAVAQVRTFVATTGTDNLTCARIDPCRTFNAAIAAVQAGGEVVVLDSGGYGPTTITKSVAIIAPAGLHAAIAPTAGDAILVTAGATARVTVRNLSLTLLGGSRGINAVTFGELYIEDCLISQAVDSGIHVAATINASKVFVSDSEIRGNGLEGFVIDSSSATSFAAISRTRSNKNFGNGFVAATNAKLTCTDCEAHSNGAAGFVAEALGNTTTNLWCDRCVASDNTKGFYSFGAEPGIAWIALARSAAYGNFEAGLYEYDGGRIQVLTGTTALFGNGTNKIGTIGALIADTP